MSAIYLIDLKKTSIVGRFEDADTAAIAGENHLAGGYYVGDAGNLAQWKRDELRTILANLGQNVKGNWSKEQFLERIVTLADTAEFAPLMKEEPEPEKKTRKPREGIKARIRAALEAGDVVCATDYADHKVTFQTAISDLRSAKYCGKGQLPLNIVREGDCYRLA